MIDWGAFLSAFGLVFVAEFGDKTQLAVVAQTCKHRGQPWAVLLGASAALTLVTALGAAAGQLVGRVIPLSVIRWLAAAAFLIMGLLIAQEAKRESKPAELTCALEEASDGSPAAQRGRALKAFLSTLGLLFVAELGDKTQLAVLSMASRSGRAVPAFLGGALALLAVTAIGVVGGQGLCRVIPTRTLLAMSALAFIVMGALMASGIL
jgi:putative Ca2+/H+ antiporter (TMEM165/GDT1 family)